MPPPPPPLPPPQNPYNPHPHMLEANGGYQSNPDSPALIVTLNVINAITQLLLGAVMFCAFAFAVFVGEFDKNAAAHIYLCVIGYVLLMSQAVLSFNSHAGWAYSLKYPEKRLIHGIMQILGSILAIVGSIIRIADLTDHFQTAHGVTGIIAMIFTFLSLIGGVLNFIFPAKMNTTLSKTMHMVIGSLTITIAFICLCLAFNNYYKFFYGSIRANLAISFTVFALAGILTSGSSRTISRVINGASKY